MAAESATATQGQLAGESAQAGALDGMVVGDSRTYGVPDGLSPADKYAVAIRFLDAGAGPRAAALIGEAVSAGFAGDGATSANEVGYRWLLAILSGRAFDQLGPRDFLAVRRAGALIDRAHPDEWLRPLDLLSRLVEGLRVPADDGGPDPAFRQLLAEYLTLPARYLEDFERHLDPMLSCGLDDDETADTAAQAELLRMSDNRAERAWKYFRQAPLEPRPRSLTPPVFPLGSRLAAGFGALVFIAGTALAIDLLQLGGVIRAVVLSGLIALLGITAALCGIAYVAMAERQADKERDFGQHHFTRYSSPMPASASDGLPSETEDDAEADQARRTAARRAWFVRMATSHLSAEFRQRSPRADAARTRWRSETAGLRESLRNEILIRYGEPQLRSGSVDWLITWRVAEIERKFKTGTLRDYREKLRPRTRHFLGLVGGVALGAMALLYALVLAGVRRPVDTAIAAVLLIIGGLVLALSGLDKYLVMRHRVPADQKEADEQHEAEKAEHRRWQQVLADRPSDAEMARWLDFDKLHLRRLALHQFGLSCRDILSSATMTEPAAGCTLVRMPYGPPRYSAYRVTVFLFTRTGVRQVAMTLDTSTGDVGNQVRKSFRYDAITSARVHETGVIPGTRPRSGKPVTTAAWTISQSRSDALTRRDAAHPGVNGSFIVRQEFVLSLGNAEQMPFLVESLDQFVDDIGPAEDPASLLDLALGASGVSAALRTLEEVSGHGSQWVTERLGRLPR